MGVANTIRSTGPWAVPAGKETVSLCPATKALGESLRRKIRPALVPASTLDPSSSVARDQMASPEMSLATVPICSQCKSAPSWFAKRPYTICVLPDWLATAYIF